MQAIRTVKLIALAAALLLLLYDVTFVFDLGGERYLRSPDPGVETEYDRCYREKDDAMHSLAFGSIDNPDVQREYISANRQRIVNECREEFPQRMIDVSQITELNLIDLHPRFW